MSGTLGHVCNTANWGSQAGVMVCNIYKTLFTFSLFAAMSALALVILDIKVRRRQTSLGKYNQMRESDFTFKPGENAFASGALGRHHDENPDAWQRAGHEPVDYNTRASSDGRIRSQHFGYTSPSEQTHYDSGMYGDRR